ncbi:MAG: FAD-dependent oxidoreductase [Armatimonadota bacterium]|nr:FAD-dependent oxidoreductase [Armatimonadota bacterium]
MLSRYDVVIIGAGPAGIFSALELSKREGIRAAMFEKGPDIDERTRQKSLLSGWGGAGAFSDGKLTLSPDVGGQLGNFLPVNTLQALIHEVDGIYIDFGAPDKVYGTNEDDLEELRRKAILADLRLIPSQIRHMGTDACPEILRRMRDTVRDKIDIHTDTAVASLLTKDSRITGIETTSGEVVEAECVIVAPGREGADWLASEARRLGLKTVINPVDVGVRVETSAAVMEDITSKVYEPKLLFNSRAFDDRVRSFCVCPHGEVVLEKSDGVMSVNGHSYARKKTENTNFALLVSTNFTEPFHEPITYGRYLATLANLLSGGVIVQRLGDLQSGHRSTESRIAKGVVRPTLESAVPGDLSFVLPYRHMAGLLEMIAALDKLAPGVGGRHTLLYGVEVKFYSSRLEVSPSLETVVQNLFSIGDGAGITRGLVQASASGLVAAREVAARIGHG